MAHYGIRLTRPSPALLRLFNESEYATLAPRAEVDPQGLSRLMRESGYTKLRDGQVVDPPSTWLSRRFADGVSSDVVYVARDSSILGHLSVSRTYSATWVVHQLATLPDHLETSRCRRVLYSFRIRQPQLQSSGDASFLAYFDLRKRWHKPLFLDFATRAADAQQVVVAQLDRLERVSGPHPAQAPVHPLELTSADHFEDIVRLCRAWLRPSKGRAYSIG